MKNTKKQTVIEKRDTVRETNEFPRAVMTTPHACSCQEGACCAQEEKTCCCRKGSGLLKTTVLAASIWGAAFIISGAILMTNKPIRPHFMPKSHPIAKTTAEPAVAAKVSEADFKKFVKQNPQFIVDTVNEHLRAQEQKQAAAAAAAQPQVAPDEIVAQIIADKSNYSLGNPNGKFVIIEFFDHQCGWCKRTNAALHEALAQKENGNIRWIPIDTPIFGDKSKEIARFVLAAGKQGKYAEMHTAVGEAKSLNREELIKIAETLKLDTKKLVADADGDELKAKLEANEAFTRQLNINGVPMLIVNGKINPGALLGERLEAALKEAREMK